MKEALLICEAVAEVKTPDMGQVLGVLGNWELPVGQVRGTGGVGRARWGQVVEARTAVVRSL